jgi:hypothetical protein
VTSWRVNTLLALCRKGENCAQLENLLIRYQDLRPDLVKRKQMRRNKTTKVYQGQLERSFAAIWTDREPQLEAETEVGGGLDVPLLIWGSTATKENAGDKKSRLCLIPSLVEENLEAPPSKKPRMRYDGDKTTPKLVSLHECTTVGDMVRNLTHLKRPSQALSLMGSPQTFHLIMLNPNAIEMQERFSMTLYYTLHNEFFSMSRTKGQNRRKLDVLCRINQFQDWIQQGIPVVGRFLAEYLVSWNGEDCFIEIYKLIVYLQMTDFNGKFCFPYLPSRCTGSKISQYFYFRTQRMHPRPNPVTVQCQVFVCSTATCLKLFEQIGTSLGLNGI